MVSSSPSDKVSTVERLHHRWAQWMYQAGRPNRMASAMNRFWQAVGSSGLWSRLATLEVRGRRSGRITRLPVVIADYHDERYLVAMLGRHAAWVANVRASHGYALLHYGRYEAVHLQEIEIPYRAPILRRYLNLAPGARPHIPVSRHAPLAEFEAVAADYPVFRIDPARGAPLRRDGGIRSRDGDPARTGGARHDRHN